MCYLSTTDSFFSYLLIDSYSILSWGKICKYAVSFAVRFEVCYFKELFILLIIFITFLYIFYFNSWDWISYWFRNKIKYFFLDIFPWFYFTDFFQGLNIWIIIIMKNIIIINIIYKLNISLNFFKNIY